jgi:ABC-type protease/lipase transport system fused ATPase/permease subunit
MNVQTYLVIIFLLDLFFFMLTLDFIIIVILFTLVYIAHLAVGNWSSIESNLRAQPVQDEQLLHTFLKIKIGERETTSFVFHYPPT